MRLPSVPQGLEVTPWPPVLATRGPGSLRAMHSHHAMHCILALEGELRIRTSRAGRWATAAGVLTPPDQPHALDARGIEMLVIFLDPESDAGARLRLAIHGPCRLITARERDVLVRGVEEPQLVVRAAAEAWSRRAARTLGLDPRRSARVLHPRVRRLLDRLRASSVEENVSLEGLATAVGLSPGRLMHVFFTESTGIPLRAYLSWLRVQRAACAIVGGASITEAAHLAGFADASHLCRTLRRRMGVSPSALRPMRSSEGRPRLGAVAQERG